MSSVETSFKIYNGMIGPLRSIIASTNVVINSFAAMENASSKAIDAGAIEVARRELSSAAAQFEMIEAEIKRSEQAQIKFNEKVSQGEGATDRLLYKVKSVAAAAVAGMGLRELITLSDSMTSNQARLDLIVGDNGSVDALERKIFASAQRARGAYLGTTNVIAKLGITAGNAFDNTDEIIAFTELMNKNFIIGGASVQEQAAGMYQLTQAMAAGKLQGDEFRSIMENAPLLARAIADFTGKSMGDLKEMSAEGEITADIIKGAMFAASDQINERFAAMPMTFGQLANYVGNILLQTFQPVIQVIGSGAQFIYENWSTLSPVFFGLAAAIGAYSAALLINKICTIEAMVAAKAFFVTLLTNPMFWIALAIGAVVALIYRWVQSVGGAKVAWLIFTNAVITGAENWRLAFAIVMAAIANYATDTKVKVLNALQSMINGAINLINSLIDKLNKIPGVSIDAIAQVTFAADAALDAEAIKQQRISGVTQLAADIAAARAVRAQNLDSARAEAAANLQNEIDLSALAASSADIAENTDKMARSMDILDEDLKYIRDIAERDAINRFTTAEIKVEVQNSFGDVHKEADIDGVMTGIEEKANELLASMAEGTHE